MPSTPTPVFFRHVPAPPLSDVVSSIWYAENQPSHRFERFLPTAGVDLVVNLRDGEVRRYELSDLGVAQRFAGPVVSGAHAKPYAIDTAQQASLLGVRFRPGCARSLLGIPLDTVSDAYVALSELWGDAAFALQDAVTSAVTPQQRCARAEALLTTRLSPDRLPNNMILSSARALAATRDPSPVGAIARASGVSARRFIEVFRREVGMAPKQFARVRRFHRAIQLLDSVRHESLSALALAAGYCDQSHLTREFTAHSGLSPGAYRSTRGAYDNQVPL